MVAYRDKANEAERLSSGRGPSGPSRLQERACAFVTLRPGATLSLAEACRHLAAEGFSKHFWPERLEVIETMPRTATGKIQKFVLRESAKQLAPAMNTATIDPIMLTIERSA